jgi:uncharacterized protein DUF3857/transglutaminase superfamily protein
MSHRLFGFFLLILLSAAPAFAGEELPPWLQQAVAQKAPAYDKKVPAVVLLREQGVTVGDDGRVVTTTTVVIRILAREGREEAVAREVYVTDAGKVRDMRAWLMRSTGEVKRFGKDETMDVAAAMNDVYNEVRFKVIDASSQAGEGDIFAYQTVSEMRSVFSQLDFNFQENTPTLLSRYTLTLPAGWRASSVTFNSAKIEPTTSGATQTWEMRNLPFIETEPASPKWANLVPRLAVSYFPASGTQNPGIRTFENWTDVARWMSEMEDPQATINDDLAVKAQQLTANAKTELEKIQAIGRYVQNLQYIAIQTGIGRGGGYRPHLATEVFAKSYGDCKDKANLMRAMLKAVKIDSYLVSIFSGDPTYVREEWASPQQFNHCIIAVRVSDETKVPSIVQHPTLGRLLIFDATDENTAVGDLPDHEQGSLALIDHKDSTALLRMPVTPPEANRLERQTDAELDANGTITVSVRDRAAGHSAVQVRRMFRGLSRPDFTKVIEGWVTAGATGAKLTKIEPTDNQADASFDLNIDFRVFSYGQLMQNRLLVFNPAIVSRLDSLALTDTARKHPVVLNSRAYTETVRIKLPEGFDVDELPDAVKLEAAFGNYTSTYAVKDGQLTFTRTLVQRAATVPADQYATVRNFFERIRAAEQSPVVLARK